MAKMSEKEKTIKKQQEIRNTTINKVNTGLIAFDVLMNKKSEYMALFINDMTEENKLKMEVVNEIMDEVLKQCNELAEKLFLSEE